MLIENPDVFKSWLTSILEPLCDADPAALAKYVYALVKKDKPVEELREVMVDQLDVFLQQETKPFVEMLFTSLESQEYLKQSHDSETTKQTPPSDAVEQEKQPETENNHVEDATTNGDSERAAVPRHRVVVTRGPNPAKLIAHGPVPAPAPGPVAPQHQQQHAPRGPHHEQTLVKVVPLTELLEEPVDQLPRRRDRRGDSLREKEDRRRRRSRSWERRARARNRHARDNDHVDPRRYENRRATSRSPSPRGRYRNRSPPLAERQPTRSRSRSPVPIRERDHERERDRLRAPREAERDRMSRDREHRDRISRSRDRERSRERSRDRSRERSRGSLSPVAEPRTADHNDAYKRRCRDFDEMGYCLRGDLCQWDHGNDPLVLEDSALTRVLTIPPSVPEYNPLTPDIWCGGAGFPPYPHPHPHHPHPPPGSITIPIVRHEVPPPPGVTAPPMPMPRHPPPPKKNFDYNRIGPARPPLPANAANCSLEVKKVPRGMNDITHLNNHFCKFGKIVNIQVCYEGDPEAALITFSNPAEANVAYKSTEAVLNNRFIKVFWHNPENKQENTAPAGQMNNKPAERSNSQHPMSHNKVLINRDNIKATQDIRQQAEKELKELTNGQQEQQKKEPAPGVAAAVRPTEKSKQVIEMYKRAQALLETQLQQQVLLIQKLESGNVTGAQKAALMEAINSAQEGIEKLQKELVAYNGIIKQMQANAKKPKTREEAQKEILDAELDMFTKQQEGQDVTDLIKKIAELRRQMALQFPVHPSVRRTHSRGGRFNSATRFTRGALNNKVFSVNQSVDHRPRALLISGFEADELDALVAHFSQYGEVISKQAELSVPQLVLQYKSRAHAENAALHGKHYSDRTLSITWVTNNKATQGQTTVEQRNAATVRNGDLQPDDSNTKQETSQNVSEYALLGFDEEEEEDAEEDRSWRR